MHLVTLGRVAKHLISPLDSSVLRNLGVMHPKWCMVEGNIVEFWFTVSTVYKWQCILIILDSPSTAELGCQTRQSDYSLMKHETGPFEYS